MLADMIIIGAGAQTWRLFLATEGAIALLFFLLRLVLPILKGKFGVPAILGMMAVVSVLGLVVTLVFGREDTE